MQLIGKVSLDDVKKINGKGGKKWVNNVEGVAASIESEARYLTRLS